MSLAEKTKRTLKELGQLPKYGLGQNFLIDDAIRQRIFELAQVEPQDVVEEIGPGLGILTKELAQKAHAVIAVEADKTFAEYIRVTYPNVLVIQGDALKVDVMNLCGKAPHKLVANLPYSIAATVVLNAFSNNVHLESATVMVQKEVAERMKAEPGTKAYGAYTAKLRLYARATASFDVAPKSFFPAPHVHSTVIKLVRHPLETDDPSNVADLITVAFAQRRKTLVNNLKSGGYKGDAVLQALKELDLPADIRAERITIQNFIELKKMLA